MNREYRRDDHWSCEGSSPGSQAETVASKIDLERSVILEEGDLRLFDGSKWGATDLVKTHPEYLASCETT
jgi:hypothetical protein